MTCSRLARCVVDGGMGYSQTAKAGVLLLILYRSTMQDDVDGAVGFVKSEVRRLLEGGCELSEFVMTGGLWRLTGRPSTLPVRHELSDMELPALSYQATALLEFPSTKSHMGLRARDFALHTQQVTHQQSAHQMQ